MEHPRVDAVSALLDLPPEGAARRGSAFLLAHGAGAPMTSDLLEAVAVGLAERGFGVLRFDYPYAERARREGRRLPPDRRPRLEDAHRRALAELRARFPNERALLAGRSMGGRIASHLAAEGADCDGLAFLAYPLHPKGRPEERRSEHFPTLAQPALFLQGTRDALCDLGLLRAALATWGGRATLRVVEDGDHAFEVRERTGRTREDVLAEIVAAIDAWEAESFPD